MIKKAIGGLTQATMGTEPVKSIRSPVTRVPPAMSQVAQTDQIINRMGGQLKRLVGRRVTAMAEGGKVGAIKKAVSRMKPHTTEVLSRFSHAPSAEEIHDTIQGDLNDMGHPQRGKTPFKLRKSELVDSDVGDGSNPDYFHEVTVHLPADLADLLNNAGVKKAEGGKVGAIKRAINSGLSKLSIGELNKRRIALESQDAFYDATKNAELKKQWQAIDDEATRRGISLIDDQ